MDLILLDTPTGLGRIATRLARSADELLLVTTPEPTSFTNAYACLRALRGTDRSKPPWIVVNQAQDAAEAKATAERIRGVARRFLATEPVFLGYVPADPAIPTAVRRQEPLLNLFPDAPASGCIDRLAQKLMASPDPDRRRTADPRGRRRKVANMEDAHV
jgi:flagellar biosynthesis protein FlhG